LSTKVPRIYLRANAAKILGRTLLLCNPEIVRLRKLCTHGLDAVHNDGSRLLAELLKQISNCYLLKALDPVSIIEDTLQ